MAADVRLNRHTGSSGSITKTRVDSGGSGSSRLSASDSPTPGTSNPITIPVAGSNYSYWASFRLEAFTSPAGTIDNIQIYMDGSNDYGTGVTLNGAKASTGADAGYREATGTLGTSGTLLNTTNHTGLDESPVSAFGWTSGSTKSITGSITNPSTGDFGDFMVLQLAIASTASAGTLSTETITFQYDET